MNYFRLAQDKRVLHAVEPDGIARVIKKEYLTLERMNELDAIDRQFSVVEKKHNDYIDFIERPVALFSDVLKQLIEKYNPNCPFKPVILAEITKSKQTPYWLAIPPKIACLAPETEFHRDGTVKKLVIEEALAAPYPFFQVEGIHEPYVVVNIELAESILRRSFRGLRLQQVQTAGRWQELFAQTKGE
ncbi:serine protease [Metasolibacillus meyeri]|uniref:Serine protease n=1 Tax=Metasolibacillus meyeri TaxID=1071052 RepID=A0AAW9NQU1_9BACL|nr:serine protease [Metasolibacillus meyeri]MEC1180067.1 serine protease [Metasolibacillus meyeri]